MEKQISKLFVPFHCYLISLLCPINFLRGLSVKSSCLRYLKESSELSKNSMKTTLNETFVSLDTLQPVYNTNTSVLMHINIF